MRTTQVGFHRFYTWHLIVTQLICLSVLSYCLFTNDCALFPFSFPLSLHPLPGSFCKAEEYAVEGKIATLHSVGPWHAADLSATSFAVAGCLLMLCPLSMVGSIVSLDCGYKTFRGPKFSPMISSCLFNLIMFQMISFEIFAIVLSAMVVNKGCWGKPPRDLLCLVHLYEQKF